MTATIDEVAKTLGEFEALAQQTGQWDGADPVEFSADGVTWLPVWVKTADHQFPPFARATVRRKGVAAPTVMIVAWDESVPAADDWRELWERKPMKLFGSFALRSAIRHAFRDVVGELRGPDEDATGPSITTATADRTDWDTQLADAPDVAALDLVWKDMRADRARTPAREVAYRARRSELVDEQWTPAPRSARMQEFLAEQATEDLGSGRPSPVGPPASEQESHGEPAPEPRPGRVPQDHLPGNRAARRAASKRGRRK